MELRHLKYFVAVAEMGSVSRATEKLFIAQPPLSMQIKQLEDEVGVPLLLRYARGVRPTAAGTAFLGEAKAIIARAERAKRLARHAGDWGALPGLAMCLPPVTRYCRVSFADCDPCDRASSSTSRKCFRRSRYTPCRTERSMSG